MKLFKLSPFVKKQFNIHSQLETLVEGNLDLQQDWLDYQVANSHLDVFALTRKYRQSRLALIAAQDSNTTNLDAHIKALKQTSLLATLLINTAYQHALQEIQQKYGNVINLNNKKQHFIIFALGKLGGHELNYSSDVDLVFCYSGNGQSNGNKCIEAQSYFNHLGRRVIQILENTTIDGIVYRVDMRLRPFGSAAPLSCSVQHLLTYLENEGRDWERYAWMRASCVTGDKLSASATLNNIQPFIYRKYLDYSIFDSLRQIKKQIERSQINDQDNIKLGVGGIREIEFIVQTLQITFGGRNKHLRGNNLYQQMHKLCEFKHITVKDLQHLTVAWLFLRKLENLCQIIEDRASHHLPKNAHQLAQCMNLKGHKQLITQLQEYKANVNNIFKQLFINNQTTHSVIEPNHQIQAIKDEISQRNIPKTVKHKIYATFDTLTPLLAQYENPEIIIRRFVKIINSIIQRQSYLSMLIESPRVLNKLMTHISISTYFSNCIAKTPSLLELLFEEIEPEDFDISYQWNIFFNRSTTNNKDDDAQNTLELLTQFKQRIQFLVVLSYIDKIHSAQNSCKILSQLAEIILSNVIKIAWRETNKTIQTTILDTDLIIVAYGSLATKTMHLSSDLDLAFVLTQQITDTNHKFVMRWIRRIIHFLSFQNYSGNLYQLDTQLRPNGNSGAVVVSQDNFEYYQINNAWTWEHAALIKTRAIYATKAQKEWFDTLRTSIISQKRDEKQVINDLTEMANKMNLQVKNHENQFSLITKILIKKNKHNYLLALDELLFKELDEKLKYSIN